MSFFVTAHFNVRHGKSDARIFDNLQAILRYRLQYGGNDYPVGILTLNETAGHREPLDKADRTIPDVRALIAGGGAAAQEAIIFRTNLFELLDGGFQYPRISRYARQGPGAGGEFMTDKHLVIARLSHKASNRRVQQATVHSPASIEASGGPNNNHPARLRINREQVVNIKGRLRDLRSGGQVILNGDFNWNLKGDDGSYRFSPRGAYNPIEIVDTYRKVGNWPGVGTMGRRYIDATMYLERNAVLKPRKVVIFDVDPEGDHRVVATLFEMSNRGSTLSGDTSGGADPGNNGGPTEEFPPDPRPIPADPEPEPVVDSTDDWQGCNYA